MSANEPKRDVWIYLDATALIDFEKALGSDPLWIPPEHPSELDLRKIAVARLFFYSRRPHPVDGRQRYLALSGVGRAEISANGRLDWTLPVFFDIDYASDAPSAADVQNEAERLIGLGAKERDAGHLSRATLTEYIDLFVTDDKWVLTNSGRLGLRDDLVVCSVVEAADGLMISAGETPPIAPGPSSPLAMGPRWWIP